MIEFVKPMMAHRWEEKLDHLLDSNEYIAEEKLDGHRVHVFKNDGQVHVLSRLGNPIEPGWWYDLPLDEGDYIDCELVIVEPDVCNCEGLEKQNGSSLVSHFRGSHPDAMALVVFDVLYSTGRSLMDSPYLDRRATAVAICFELEPVEQRVRVARATRHHKRGFLKGALEKGADGIVLKQEYSTYVPGSRSLSWVKVKQTDTYDVVFTGIVGPVDRWTVRPGNTGTDGVVYPDGKESSTFKAGWVRLGYGFYDGDGQLREVGHCLTGLPKDMKKLIGQVGEVRAWGQYGSGALRHPQFVRLRDDKAPEECVFDFREGG